MNTQNCENWGYEEPKKSSYVLVEGSWVPLDEVEFLNVEEDIYGRDLITFKHKNEVLKSLVITKFN
jgi:hypothetical protein